MQMLLLVNLNKRTSPQNFHSTFSECTRAQAQLTFQNKKFPTISRLIIIVIHYLQNKVLLELTSHGIHYLCSVDLSKSFSRLIVSISIFSRYFLQQTLPGGKSFSQLIVLIFIFSQYFFYRFCSVEKCGVTPHCLYRDSLTFRSRYITYFPIGM